MKRQTPTGLPEVHRNDTHRGVAAVVANTERGAEKGNACELG